MTGFAPKLILLREVLSQEITRRAGDRSPTEKGDHTEEGGKMKEGKGADGRNGNNPLDRKAINSKANSDGLELTPEGIALCRGMVEWTGPPGEILFQQGDPDLNRHVEALILALLFGTRYGGWFGCDRDRGLRATICDCRIAKQRTTDH